MDSLSSMCAFVPCVWNCLSKQASYFYNLEENLETLRGVMAELKNINRDLKRRVQIAEKQHQMVRTNQVNGWLQRVHILEKDVSHILDKGDRLMQKKCKNTPVNYDFGKEVVRFTDDVKELIDKGQFTVVADKPANDPVDERPLEMAVGLDSELSQVWRCIEDKNVGVIGIYGMGGVGKTTLLKKVNNKSLNAGHDFDLVIWIVVSKEPNVEKIREVIYNKLGVLDECWRNKSEEEKASEILKVIRRRKFLLLLDDLWDRLDLLELGFPLDDNRGRSKVLFTTRSEEVCGLMEARATIKVQCLLPEDALTLFTSKVGEETLTCHPDIPALAEVVAKECKGLPLALITVGRAMSCRRNPWEWKHAIKVLESYPSEFSGMGDHVFPILKFSYDSLKDDTLKSCFLYCSIYPEDCDIWKNDLIELWIAEGFLSRFDDDVDEARGYGEYIIGSLKLACLLENGDSEDHVKMHDVIRDMALWLACECGVKDSKILVKEHAGLVKMQGFEKWEEAKKISIWGPSFDYLSGTPRCPVLETLLIRDTGFRSFPYGFFESMHALKVLDLSGNTGLDILPDGIDDLIMLLYLNISKTAIRKLPDGFRKLKMLKILIVEDMIDLSSGSNGGIISTLLALRVFCKTLSTDQVMYCKRSDDGALLLQELESLDHLQDLCIPLFSFESLKKLLRSPKLQRCVRQLHLTISTEMESLNVPSSAMKRMQRLEMLDITNCHCLTQVNLFARRFDPRDPVSTDHESFRSLRHVYVYGCPLIEELTWLVYAPRLQILEVYSCDSLTEIIAEDYGVSANETNIKIFTNLTELVLDNLPELHRVFPGELALACLERITVDNCPNLKKLPLRIDSAKKSLKEIKGMRWWWGKLEWDSKAMKEAFSSKFVAKDDNIRSHRARER